MNFNEEDYEILDECPWCGADDFKIIYYTEDNCHVAKCNKCNLVLAKKRLNSSGLSKYWKHYLSQMHLIDTDLVEKRKQMYKLEFELIDRFINKDKKIKVLDVGCGAGNFLDIFNENGYQCFGVEFGEEAAREVAGKYKVWKGIFSNLDIDEKFDLIIFRGVIQYIPYPKDYLEKAFSVLNEGGYIYITSVPNVDSVCFKLFKEKFTLPVSKSDFFAFTTKHFIDFFDSKKCKKVSKYFFYEETPYANIEKDILLVAEAIKLKNQGRSITFKAPPFWGNLFSLVFRKE